MKNIPVNVDKHFDKMLRIVGLNIAKYRKLEGLTQEQLADITGISRSYIGIIEAAGITQQISLQYLYIIAKALDVPFIKLFDGID